jgi:flagellar motor protein MotB
MLERLGVPPEVIVVTALSDQEPTYFEVMPAGEAGNRRVEIFFEN